ncbi:MAG TPA: malto-oligosyltrehalose trehalohydrolase [Terracidiphilus sp.]|jgi:maltooligosyltrehalose trehalohydrolase|nr:malto-oligosyltrehalose trehalohydrolase [Terracidiphilus sp.]
MHRFEVWAPLAKTVAIQINGTRIRMQPVGERGWWAADVEDAKPGSDYGYGIDDDSAYPDPRSQWQPDGVHGLSRVYDQAAFRWSDAKFEPVPLASAIVYELHVGTFTPAGTLDAAIDKLDRLVDLGVTHVELMPVASFAGEYGWGYDGVGLFAVHQPYGGPDALKRLVDAAHAKGLAVLLDVVYNHFGPVGNYAEKFGPYLIDAHKTPWGAAVNLEGAHATEVRRFFCDNALMWLHDFHLDGLRLDAVHALVDRSAIHFLEQLATEVDTLSTALGKRLALIAESDLNDPRIVTPREAGGLGMDAQWSDDFHHALFAALLPEPEAGYYSDFGSLGQLAKAIERTFVYDGIYSRHRRHVHGRPTGSLSQHRFLGFIQNHDQIGNRAQGERLTQSVGCARAKSAAALVLLGPFVPMLFQGEEWAASAPFQYFAHHDDPEMARAVSEGRKREFEAFGWAPSAIPDPEKRETFERSRLNWDERTEPQHAEMLDWYRALIALRRTTPCLNNGEPGNVAVAYDENEKWLRMQRGSIVVVCNWGSRTCRFALGRASELLLASTDDVQVLDEAIELPVDAVVVVREREG